jgi:hypothetical protein
MNKHLFFIFAFSTIAIAAGFLVMPISVASPDQWIASYEVRDLRTTGLVEDRLEGLEYNITFMINVPTNSPTTVLNLTTILEHPTLVNPYWEIHGSYPGINLSSWNPNLPYVMFQQYAGNLSISSYGKIMEGITLTTYGGIVLHRTVENYTVIRLNDPLGFALGQIAFNVIDGEIKDYQNLLSAKMSVVGNMTSGNVVHQYVSLSESIISQAKDEASLGFVDKAKNLLNLIPTGISGLPSESSSSIIDSMFIPVAGGLSVAVILVALLFARSRRRMGYVLNVLEEQIKDLEGLVMKASRVDKSISTRLEELRDKLRHLVGV